LFKKKGPGTNLIRERKRKGSLQEKKGWKKRVRLLSFFSTDGQGSEEGWDCLEESHEEEKILQEKSKARGKRGRKG